MKKTICIIATFLLCISLYAQNKQYKINGVTFRGPDKAPLTTPMISHISQAHANWVAFVPTVLINKTTLALKPPTKAYHWYESEEASIEGIKLAKEQGYRLFLKPHIRLSKEENVSIDRTGNATWRGDFNPESEADWKIWEQNYEAFILKWAKIAQSYQVDMLCIGTELKISAMTRAAFWQQLIPKVKTVYTGKLTYSANWDEYDKITFWDQLDYIGIDAYFPVSKSRVPYAWKTAITWEYRAWEMKEVSTQYNRPVLITEFGYRNIEYAAKNPWTHEKVAATRNDQAQSNLYEAFFRSFANKDWVAGYFLWQWWWATPTEENTLFTPQGKPAMEVLKKWYKKQ